MAIDKSNDENIQDHTEAYYEKVASQEEIYLEEIEECARAVLISERPSPSQLSSDNGPSVEKTAVTDASNTPAMAEGVDEQLGEAAEELITGDSDDPPLSDEAVVKMRRTS